jgi:putrescine aminotransferase
MKANISAQALRVQAPDTTFDTKALQELDAAHYLHPFTDHAALRERGARVASIYGTRKDTRSSTACPACGA